MKLKRKTKLNAVCYKVPNMNLVLNSLHMNMTAGEYIRKSQNIGKSLLSENWIFDKEINGNSSHKLYSYKCRNGTVLTLDQKLK